MEEGAHETTSVRIDGRKLAHEVQLRGLTAAEFAKLARLSPSTMSGVVAHDNPVSARVARRIAGALHDTPVITELVAIAPDEDRAA
jgi:transcriptional regulator with XRE-family HTH domain